MIVQTSQHVPQRSSGWPIRLLPVAIPLVLTLALALHSLGDWDIWLHERAGRDIVQTHTVTDRNGFSFNEPDHPWTNHEWLFQILVTTTAPTDAAADVGGWQALRILLVTVLLLVVLSGDGIPERLRRGDRIGPGWFWLGLPLLLGVGLLWPRLILRPELVSYILLVLVVRQSEALTGLSGSSRPRRGVVLAGLTALLWAQCHGFAALAPVLWLLAILLAPLQKRLGRTDGPGSAAPPVRARWIALAVTICALALTPNGLSGLTYPLRALTHLSAADVDLQRTIAELIPLHDSPASLHWTIRAFDVSLIWAGLWIALTWGRVSLLRILLTAVAAVMTMNGLRNIGFYGVAFLLLHTGVLATSRPLWWQQRRRWPQVPSMAVWIGLTLTLLAGGSWFRTVIDDSFYLAEGVSRRFGGGLTPAHYPIRLVEDLPTSGRTRILTNINPAGFVLSRTAAQVFLDGRTEAYSPRTWQTYRTLKRGDQAAGRALAAISPDLVLLTYGGGATWNLVRLLLAHPQWALQDADDAGLLFATTEAPSAGTDEEYLLRRRIALLEADLLTDAAVAPARFADRCIAIGELWGLLGATDRQAELLSQGLRRAPGHPIVAHNLGTLEMNDGRPDVALEHFTQALRVNPRMSGSWVNRGVCLARLGRQDDAVLAFREALAVDDDNFDAWANLGSLALADGDRATARSAFTRAAALRPDDQRLQALLRELRTGSP